MNESPLIYDVSTSGHRRRGVEVLARLLSGQVLLETPRKSLTKLLRHRGCVVWQTADYKLAEFTALALLRSALGRKTIAICYRNNENKVDGKKFRHAVRRMLFRFWNVLPLCTALSTCAPVHDHASTHFLYDIELWDLAVCPLPDAPVPDTRHGRRTVLFLGSVSYLKGIDFFLDTALAARQRGSNWNFVLVGAVDGLAAEESRKLTAANVATFPGPKDDAMFVSFMRQADLLWCCYNPIYDQSSGIFGRSIQIGSPTVTRQGSRLEEWQSEYGSGFAVAYGDTQSLLDALDQPLTPDRPLELPDRSAQNLRIFQQAKDRLLQLCD
jgi:glycosyltransferase involved in cell wall biosynthesis